MIVRVSDGEFNRGSVNSSLEVTEEGVVDR